MPISLTRAQAATMAWVLAAPGSSESETKLFIPHIEQMCDQAVKVMCDRVVQGMNWRYLQQAFSGTLSIDTGATGLGKAVIATNVMGGTLMNDLQGFLNVAGVSMPLCYVPSVSDLYLPKRCTDFGYFTVIGQSESSCTILAAKSDGTALTGAITGSACSYCTFSTIPVELQDEYIDTLADLAREKLLVARTTQRFTGKGDPYLSSGEPMSTPQ